MDLSLAVASQGKRARVLVWLLGACAFLAAAGLLTGVLQHLLLAQAQAGELLTEAAEANDLRVALVEAGQALGLLASAVAWLVWVHRAYANLPLLGTGRLDHSPGWAVGCWFVPVLCLYRPYQITRELWLRSRDGNAVAEVKAASVPLIFAAWWTAWIASTGLDQVHGQLAASAGTLAQLERVTWVGLFSDLIWLGGATAALTIVRQIDAGQRAAAARVRAVAAFE